MRQLLLALACISALAATQNVLAIAPAPTTAAEAVLNAVDTPNASSFVASPQSSLGEEAPRPAALGLLVAGIAGLTVAGGRRREREQNTA